MKTSCNVIKDLLPLYHDGVCSRESRELVEEHLKECEECRMELKNYSKSEQIITNMNETNAMHSAAEEWKKSKLLSFLKGGLIVALMACAACVIAYNVIGVHVESNGLLVEPFALIPLFFLFALVALIFGILYVIVRVYKKNKRKAA